MSETVDQRACQRCGAQNRLDTDFCWQCYTPFRGGPSTFRSEERTTPLARAVSGRTATMAPREEVTTRSTGFRVGIVIRFLVLGGLVAGGWFAWQHFRGFPFPDDINGAPRIESSAAESAFETVQAEAQELGIEVDLAIYGTSVPQPTYGIAVLDIPEPEFWEQVGVSSQIPLTPGLVREVLAAQTMFCVPAATDSTCVWLFDDRMVALTGLGQQVSEVRPVAQELREDLG
jgi:hypothetical protein